MNAQNKFKILVLSDTSSWMNPKIKTLLLHLKELGHEVFWAHRLQDTTPADFCFCLSFSFIIPSIIRQQFKHTLVVHESNLPAGKGWSPLSWQILEGKNLIPITLFEANDEVDSGLIYEQRWIEFEGHELIDELREKQASATREIFQWFVENYPESLSQGREQQGQESYYPKRKPKDSELDANKTIAEQFNLLRVVDSERYPAFFELNGERYYLNITKGKQLKDSELDSNKTIAEQFNLLRVVDSERYLAFFELNGERYYLNITKGKQAK